MSDKDSSERRRSSQEDKRSDSTPAPPRTSILPRSQSLERINEENEDEAPSVSWKTGTVIPSTGPRSEKDKSQRNSIASGGATNPSSRRESGPGSYKSDGVKEDAPSVSYKTGTPLPSSAPQSEKGQSQRNSIGGATNPSSRKDSYPESYKSDGMKEDEARSVSKKTGTPIPSSGPQSEKDKSQRNSIVSGGATNPSAKRGSYSESYKSDGMKEDEAHSVSYKTGTPLPSSAPQSEKDKSQRNSIASGGATNPGSKRESYPESYKSDGMKEDEAHSVSYKTGTPIPSTAPQSEKDKSQRNSIRSGGATNPNSKRDSYPESYKSDGMKEDEARSWKTGTPVPSTGPQSGKDKSQRNSTGGATNPSSRKEGYPESYKSDGMKEDEAPSVSWKTGTAIPSISPRNKGERNSINSGGATNPSSKRESGPESYKSYGREQDEVDSVGSGKNKWGSEPRQKTDSRRQSTEPPSSKRGSIGSDKAQKIAAQPDVSPEPQPEVKQKRPSQSKPAKALPPDDSPSVAQLKKLIPPEALRTIQLQRRPIAPKVLVLKQPRTIGDETSPPASSGKPRFFEPEPEPNFPYTLHGPEMLKDTPEDKKVDKELTERLNLIRDHVRRKMKRKKKMDGPKFRFPEMVQALTDQGIPCPVNEDFGRLQGMHNRWDPHGTVLEYYSPMLRAFVPVNMRGRYRGCWNSDSCVQGLNISNIPPKRDALEGFVDRGRHNNIQKLYDEMSSVAIDEAHLDYLVELQSYHAETLPIPIFYDMLHIGMEVANEQLRVLVQGEGYPPNDPIFISAQLHAEEIRRKIQMYGALGVETLESERKGLGEYRPQWLKTRDEIIREIMQKKDENRYSQLANMEKQAEMKNFMRNEAQEGGDAKAQDAKLWDSIARMTNKVSPEGNQEDFIGEKI